jgi:hypothetical protein
VRQSSVGGRIGVGVAVLIALAMVFDSLVHDGALAAATTAAWLTAVLTVLYAVFWRPKLDVDEKGVTLRNPVRTVRVPWGALRGVDTRFALTLFTVEGKYLSWAAVAPGRPPGTFPPTRAPKVQDVRLPPPVSGEPPPSVAASRRLDGDAGAAAFVVELGWARWMDREARARWGAQASVDDVGAGVDDAGSAVDDVGAGVDDAGSAVHDAAAPAEDGTPGDDGVEVSTEPLVVVVFVVAMCLGVLGSVAT